MLLTFNLCTFGSGVNVGTVGGIDGVDTLGGCSPMFLVGVTFGPLHRGKEHWWEGWSYTGSGL